MEQELKSLPTVVPALALVIDEVGCSHEYGQNVHKFLVCTMTLGCHKNIINNYFTDYGCAYLRRCNQNCTEWNTDGKSIYFACP